MAESKGMVALVAVLAVVGIVLGAVSLVGAQRPQTAAQEAPKNRLIWMEAVEYKGSTEVAKLAPPENLAQNPKVLGTAFGFKWTEPEKKWEVSAYAFAPSTVVVNQGDKVTLRIFGVNGDLHAIYVENYASSPVDLNRGRTVEIAFTADKAGAYQIVCSTHEPAMRSWLVVLPRTA